MHRRAVIRSAIVSALTGLPLGASVTAGRVNPEVVDGLPNYNIVTGEEAVEDEEGVLSAVTVVPWPQTRTCAFEVEIRATVVADGDIDGTLDALSLEVEQALGADFSLGGEADLFMYAGSEGELTGELEQPVGLRTLAYQATFRVNARDPQALEG